MAFLYQIGVRFYYLGIIIASLFNRKARLWLRGRKTVFSELSGWKKAGGKSCWFHCASLGEFEQARPLIEKVKSSGMNVLITFFSPSGYEVRKNFEGADLVCYLPLDTRANAKRFLDLARPAAVFFVKYDLWRNFLSEIHARGIPLYLVSANFREEQFKGSYGAYLRTALNFFSKIFVQNEASKKILSEHTINHVTVSGDLRFDRVSQVAASAKKIQLIEQFKGNYKLLICGSTWKQDEEIIAGFRSPDFKLIIAPHEISETHINSIVQLFTGTVVLKFSEISQEGVSSALPKLSDARVLIIDNIGMLSSLYQYASIAYIGGGFGAGIHNILEATAFGAPVIFGPNHHKFPEAAELIANGGAFSISGREEFQKVMNLLLPDEMILQMASMVCKKFVQERRGATEKILAETQLTTPVSPV